LMLILLSFCDCGGWVKVGATAPAATIGGGVEVGAGDSVMTICGGGWVNMAEGVGVMATWGGG
jgi:hypothetical protein